MKLIPSELTFGKLPLNVFSDFLQFFQEFFNAKIIKLKPNLALGLKNSKYSSVPNRRTGPS